MAGKYTQSNRHARISTPLGEDVLLFKSLTGTERLGRPFQYELVLLSEEREINYKQIIGENVTVAVDKKGSEPRYFNGYISRFEQTRFDGPLREYRATVVPLPAGVRVTITARDPADTKMVARIRGLGVAGLLTEGMHHQRHHLAMARGDMMHR